MTRTPHHPPAEPVSAAATTVATRTWRAPAAVAAPGSFTCRYPARLRPRLRDRDSWRVPVVDVPVGDDSTRARPAPRPVPPPDAEEDTRPEPPPPPPPPAPPEARERPAPPPAPPAPPAPPGPPPPAPPEARERPAPPPQPEQLEPLRPLEPPEPPLSVEPTAPPPPPPPEPTAGTTETSGLHGPVAPTDDDDIEAGDDTRQHRFSGLADAMARQLVVPDVGEDPTIPDPVASVEDVDAIPDPAPSLENLDAIDAVATVDDIDAVDAVDAIHAVVDAGLAPEVRHVAREREEGDRAAFLVAARRHRRPATPPRRPPTGERPLPVPPELDELDRLEQLDPVVPEPAFLNLVGGDLLTGFARAVAEAGGTCHRVVGTIPESLLDRLVAELDTWDAVVTDDADAAELAERFTNRGVEVSVATPQAAARASLGITSAVAGVAATGSLVLDSHRDRGRLVAALPRVHVCVLPAERVVATPADVLRGLGARPAGLPSSLTLVTGPARTGGIEQLLAVGAPGPSALHVILVEPQGD